MDEYGLFGKAGSYNALAGGCAKIARFDAGATLVDVNRAQPNFSNSYRERSIIIRIGLELCENSKIPIYVCICVCVCVCM